MQFKTLAVLSFASAAIAVAPEKRQATSVDLVSIYEVLATALPSSLIEEALTNSAELSSQIASEFMHTMTPSWFTALPSNIQTYLVPVVTNAASLSGAIANASAAITSGVVANTSALSINATAISANQSAILSSLHAQNSSMLTNTAGFASTTATSKATSGASSGASSATAGSIAGSGSGTSTSTSKAGASLPTAAVGMGLAGVVGLIGVLAL